MKNMTTTMIGISLFSGLLAASNAAAYDNPPNWMPMTMTTVSLTANQLHVQTQTEAGGPAQVALIKAGSYDPAQPWNVLNNTYYSRRLGWYDSISDDFYANHSLPQGNAIYIAQTGETANGSSVAPGSVIKTYFVSEALNPTGPYTEIFGSNGPWKWDGFMDHNTNAIDAASITVPNEVFTATYLLYVGDANGEPNPAFGSTTTTWTWVGPAVIPEPVSLSAIGLLAIAALRRRP